MLAVLQARMSSQRLPGKVLAPILGEPMILRQVARLRRARAITRLVVATSVDASDDPLAEVLAGAGVEVFRGALDDVLGRFLGAWTAAGSPDRLIRLTADCPLADPDVVDACAALLDGDSADYAFTGGGGFPKGLDVEAVRASALVAAGREATSPYDREHVTPFIHARPRRFRPALLRRATPERWRWTVDTPQDFAFVTAVYEALHPAAPHFGSGAILAWQAAHPGAAIPDLS